MERPGGGTIHFHQSGTEQPVPERDAIHLLRIIQELINNAFKHSSAWHVDIQFHWNGPSLQIEVEDDGTAFSKLDSYLDVLNSKNNTLRMRSTILHAPIQYSQGDKGLLAKLSYHLPA